jgi:hypothetical protein
MASWAVNDRLPLGVAGRALSRYYKEGDVREENAL